MDYMALSTPMTFEPMSMNGEMLCVNITIFNDTDVEGNEMFTVTLERIIGLQTVDLGQTTVTITDDEGIVFMCANLSLCHYFYRAELSLSAPTTMSAEESTGSVEVCAMLESDISADVIVTLATMDDGTGKGIL